MMMRLSDGTCEMTMANPKDKKEFERFKDLAKKLVSVPKKEIDKRLEAERKEKEAAKKRSTKA